MTPSGDRGELEGFDAVGTSGMRARFRDSVGDRAWISALVLVAIGLAMRAVPAWTWWLNGDEGIYYYTVHSASAEFHNQLALNAHPPLFYWLLRAIAAVTTDPFWLRAPSILFGCLGIWVMFLFGRRLAGPVAGLLAAGMWAVLPGPVEMGQIVRPYAMQWTLLAIAVYELGEFVNLERTKALWRYSAAMTAAVFVHYGSFVVAIALGIALAVAWAVRAVNRRRWRALLVSQVPIAGAMAFLYFWHIRPGLVGTKVQQDAVEGWLAAWFVDGPGAVWQSLVGFGEFVAGGGFGLFALIAWIAALVLVARSRNLPLVVATGCTVAVALSLSAMELYPFGGTRHSGYLAVLAIPTVALGLSLVLRMRRGPRVAALAAAAILLVASGPLDGALGGEGRTPRTQELRTRAADVAAMRARLEQLKHEDGVLLGDMRTAMTLDPLFHDARANPLPTGPLELVYSRWGRNRLVFVHDWMFDVRARSAGAPNHLDTLLRIGAARLPDMRERMSHGVWMISCYGKRLPNAIDKLGRTGTTERQLVSDLVEHGRLVLFRLDAEAYLEEIRERRGR